MSLYSDIQKKVTEYRAAQEFYWSDLTARASMFKKELISYLGADELELYDRNDKKHPIVIVGEKDGDKVKDVPSTKFDKFDGKKNLLHFWVQINLSKYENEMLDDSMCFECFFWRSSDDYFVNISGRDIECRKITNRTDFTQVFDYIITKLNEFVDKTRYQ